MNKSIDLIEKKFGVNLNEVKNIYPVLIGKICAKIGINVVFEWHLDGDYLGSILKSESEFTINVNAYHSAETNMFTIAHEIGHYVKHFDKLAMSGQFIDKKSDNHTSEERQLEKQANDFAGELIMPSDKFCQIFKEKNGDIKGIAEFFRLSPELTNFRALKLGLVVGSYV